MALQAIRKNLMVELLIPNDATHYTLYGGEYVWWKKESQHPGEKPVWFFANQYLVDNHASWAIYTQDIPQTGLTEIQLAEDRTKVSGDKNLEKTDNHSERDIPAIEIKPGYVILEPGKISSHPTTWIVMTVVALKEFVYVQVYNPITQNAKIVHFHKRAKVRICG